jgi:hypothetical protein
MSLGMSAPGSYVAPEERERRLRELANRLAEGERIQPDTVSQTKREYANIKQDLIQREPNADRTGINLESDPLLSDLIADSDDETSAVTFGTGFTGISDRD